MDRRFHQSIKKHLPHTQHDLYLVNRIVSLYPYIIIALIPLAVGLMLFLRLTSRSTQIEGGLVQFWPEYRASFWECWRSGQPEESGRWLLIGCRNPKDLILSLVPIYYCGIQLKDLCASHWTRQLHNPPKRRNALRSDRLQDKVILLADNLPFNC